MRRENVPFEAERTCFLLRHALDEETCAALVEGATLHGFVATAGTYPPSYRDNDRLVRDDAELAARLYARLGSLLPPVLVDGDGTRWRLDGLNERFRFCRYRDGQRFRVHRDGAYASREDRRSRLTLQIYLDGADSLVDHEARAPEGRADFTGGRTRFYASRNSAPIGAVRAELGTAVVFDHDFWHDGEGVRDGTKHVLRTDVMYVREHEARDSGHTGYVFGVLPMADGVLATCSRDRTVRLWSTEGAEARHVGVLHGHTGSVCAMVEAGPGTLVTASRDGTVRIWESGVGRVLLADPAAFLSLAMVDERLIACGSADATIRLVDTGGSAHGSLGALPRGVDFVDPGSSLVGHAGWVWALAPLAGRLLASGSEDGTLRVWDLATRECLAAHSPGRGPVHALARLDGGSFAAGFADGHVIVYAFDRATLAFNPLQVIAAHAGEVYAIARLDDARIVSGGEDGSARVFQLRDGASVAEVSHDGFVRAVSVLADGRVVSAGYDGKVSLWRCSE